MIRNIWRATRATIVLAIVTGLLYPLVVTGIGQLAFHGNAEGSIVTENGARVGSKLIGQEWAGPEWFYGRPSAVFYDASTSGGTNLGPTSQKLADEIADRVKKIMAIEAPYHPGLTAADIPVDLVTSSASGLDPDISPAAADFEAPRVAAVRRLSLETVRALIRAHTRKIVLNLFADPSVNVLELNLAFAKAS